MSVHSENAAPPAAAAAPDPNAVVAAMHAANNFDFLRFTLATLVILSHCWCVLDGSYDNEPLYAATEGQTFIGSLAVAGFFLISGYLITGSWLRSKSISRYISNRARRILPGYIVVTILSAIIVAPLAGVRELTKARCLMWLKRAVIIDYTFDPEAFLNNPQPYNINASLWTIRYEILCYCAIPFVLLILKVLPRWTIILPTLAFVVLAGLHVKWPGLSHSNLYACFVVGAAVYVLRDQIQFNLAGALISVVLLVIASRTHTLGYLIPLAGGYVIFYIAFRQGILNHFGKYGDFSYGIYLYSFPIQQLLAQAWPNCGKPVLFVVASLLSIACGAASWFFVEKPFMIRSKKPAHAPLPQAALIAPNPPA